MADVKVIIDGNEYSEEEFRKDLISVGTKFMYSADDIKAKLKELNQIGGRKE